MHEQTGIPFGGKGPLPTRRAPCLHVPVPARR
jgi:hypothetical protein